MHSETVVVGGDAVATRRFLGHNPPLASWPHAVAAPLPSLCDLIGAAGLTLWQAAPWRNSRALGKTGRVGNAVLERPD